MDAKGVLAIVGTVLVLVAVAIVMTYHDYAEAAMMGGLAALAAFLVWRVSR